MKKSAFFIPVLFFLTLILSCNIDSSKGVYRSVVTAQEYSDATVRPFLCRLVDKQSGLDSKGYYYYNYFFISDDGLDLFHEKDKKIYHIISNEDLSTIFDEDGDFIGMYDGLIRRAAVNKVVYDSSSMAGLNILCLTNEGDLFSAYIRWREKEGSEEGEYYYDLIHSSLGLDEEDRGDLPYTKSVPVRELTPGGYFIHGKDVGYWSNSGKTPLEARTQDSVKKIAVDTPNNLSYLAEDPIGEKRSLILVGESGGSGNFVVCEGSGRGLDSTLEKLIDKADNTSESTLIAFNDGFMGFKYMGDLKSDLDKEKKDPSKYAIVRMIYQSSSYIYYLHRLNESDSLMTLSEKPGKYYMQLPMVRYRYGDITGASSGTYDGDTILSIKGSDGFSDYDWTKEYSFGSVNSDYKKELNDTDVVNIRPVMFLEDEEQKISFDEYGNPVASGEGEKYIAAEYVVSTDDNFLYILMPYDVTKSGSSESFKCVKNSIPQVITLTEYNENDV